MKDLFRELPEPLFTSALYRLLLDAATTLGSGPSLGPPKLLLSLLDCLPLAHQVCALCSLLCLLLFLTLTLKSAVEAEVEWRQQQVRVQCNIEYLVVRDCSSRPSSCSTT